MRSAVPIASKRIKYVRLKSGMFLTKYTGSFHTPADMFEAMMHKLSQIFHGLEAMSTKLETCHNLTSGHFHDGAFIHVIT
jgi:hypothetical protein